jgi:hypothetical protein
MIYFKIFDKWERTITAHTDNWGHATEGHPELIDHEGAVMTTMVTPTHLLQSDTAQTTKLYVGPVIEKGIFAGAHPISVVRYGTGNTGVWLTGYFDNSVPSLKVLWSEEK